MYFIVVSEMVDKIYALSYAVSNLVQYGADAAQISTVAEAAGIVKALFILKYLK